jgi:hypothetical protein
MFNVWRDKITTILHKLFGTYFYVYFDIFQEIIRLILQKQRVADIVFINRYL